MSQEQLDKIAETAEKVKNNDVVKKFTENEGLQEIAGDLFGGGDRRYERRERREARENGEEYNRLESRLDRRYNTFELSKKEWIAFISASLLIPIIISLICGVNIIQDWKSVAVDCLLAFVVIGLIIGTVKKVKKIKSDATKVVNGFKKK